MKQALLIYGSKQTPVDVEETADGGLIVHLQDRELFKLQPVGGALPAVIPAVENRKPVMSDLNGNPAHDWPLFVRRFQKTQADLLLGVAHYYKNRGYSAPSIDNLLRTEEDLEILLSLLPTLTAAGQLKRGHRARIAEALGIKDAGNHAKRIDAVVALVLADLGGWLEKSGPKLGNFGPSLGNEAKSTQFQKPQKAVNQ